MEVHVQVGIEEYGDQNPPAVFPNPTSDHLSVDLSTYSEARMNMAWLDLSGRIVQRIGPTVGGGLVELDMASLAPGIYLLDISMDTVQWTVRVAKL